jgi:hypothetical protein
MDKKFELIATKFMKLEFEDSDRILNTKVIIVKTLWWNSQYGEWEELGKIFIPLNKLDDFINILNKYRE